MRSARGFTLIEVLVALTIMAIMAALGWQSIDTMVRTQTLTREQGQATQRLSAGLEQWVRDLEQVIVDPGVLPGPEFDGLMFRFVRRYSSSEAEHFRIIAWSVRPGSHANLWMRWQSAPVSDWSQVHSAWSRANLWARGGNIESAQGDSATTVASVERWQLFFHHDSAWVNPQSTTESGGNTLVRLPAGVRLVLVGLGSAGHSGSIRFDWVQRSLIQQRS